MRKTVTALCVILVSGCAYMPKKWSTETTVDAFTDKQTCTVVYNDTSQGFEREPGTTYYYPFVTKVDDRVIVGVQGEKNRPVGDVQIRIDKNKPIILTSRETPIYYISSANSPRKRSSPYTAAGGKKADRIVQQLKEGTNLRMRILGFGTNTVKSTTGMYTLDQSFTEAMTACGI